MVNITQNLNGLSFAIKMTEEEDIEIQDEERELFEHYRIVVDKGQIATGQVFNVAHRKCHPNQSADRC